MSLGFYTLDPSAYPDPRRCAALNVTHGRICGCPVEHWIDGTPLCTRHYKRYMDDLKSEFFGALWNASRDEIGPFNRQPMSVKDVFELAAACEDALVRWGFKEPQRDPIAELIELVHNHEQGGNMLDRITKRLSRREPPAAAYDGCLEHAHGLRCGDPGGERDLHRLCVGCGGLTCAAARLWIEERTLRRSMRQICSSCVVKGSKKQDRLRAERTRRDWERLSGPVYADAITPNEMAEQYDGTARRVVRAFLASEALVATVDETVGANALNLTIATLGLTDEVYAEQRDHTVVLCRTGEAVERLQAVELLPVRGRKAVA